MTDQQGHHEPFRTTVMRNVGIAVVAATAIAPWFGGLHRWPVLVVLLLWPTFGGHWVDLLVSNWLARRLPATKVVQRVARVAVWFGGGILLGLGARLTAMLLLTPPPTAWLPWFASGIGFVLLELIAHAGLRARGQPSFYD